MKSLKIAVLLALALVLVVIIPASAQLGDTDTSSFTIQNISATDATISVTFVGSDGTEYTPTDLGNSITNPFTLAPSAARQIVVSQIPSTELPSGSYSVVISSDVEVVAQAGLAGAGSTHFQGAYTGFSSGATTMYIPTVAYNFFGWYSMISVQNLGTAAADVTVTISCTGGSAAGATATLSTTDLPVNASYTWALKNVLPTGLTAGDTCDGSAVVTSDQPVVAVNNQNNPTTGNASLGSTNSFEGSVAGSDVVYVGGLSKNFFGWRSALTIQALGASIDTNVTIDYAGTTWDSDTCHLTAAAPSCKLIMTTDAAKADGRYAATITSDDSTQLLAVAGSTNDGGTLNGHPVSLSNAVVGVASGTNTVAIPNIAKGYFGFKSAITCQNVGAVATAVNFSFSDYEGDAFDSEALDPGASIQVVTTNLAFLVAPYNGGATLTAVDPAGQIYCFAGNTNDLPTYSGDWTSTFNGFGYDQ
jgi:phosphotransferase system HPr-like phosphotransfer protein